MVAGMGKFLKKFLSSCQGSEVWFCLLSHLPSSRFPVPTPSAHGTRSGKSSRFQSQHKCCSSGSPFTHESAAGTRNLCLFLKSTFQRSSDLLKQTLSIWRLIKLSVSQKPRASNHKSPITLTPVESCSPQTTAHQPAQGTGFRHPCFYHIES